MRAAAAAMRAAAAPAGPPLLAVAIHDVAPRWLPEVTALREALARWGVDRVTHLAVPHFHRGVRLVDHPATCRWLRDCAAAGDELALHGYHHLQRGTPAPLLDRLRARMWTAGEGECLDPDGDLSDLLTRGRAELASILPFPAGSLGFVAPAWLEPRGFSSLLSRLGFAWHETSRFVERVSPSPSPARAPHRLFSPVIGFATRTPLRESLSVAWARLLLATTFSPSSPARLSTLRIAVHPADLHSSRVMSALERSVRRALTFARPVTTAELLSL
jgi:predicted deacetylase